MTRIDKKKNVVQKGKLAGEEHKRKSRGLKIPFLELLPIFGR